MAERKPAKEGTQQSAKRTTGKASKGFEGAMWPTAFALKELTAADEARIRALVKQAVR
jgi:hypothetical protein